MRGDPAGSIGCDGQFVCAIAVEGLEAARLLDNPSHRLQRILLPVLVRLLSAGQARAVSWLIPLMNGAAIVGGGYLLARRLARCGLGPLYALVYTGYMGTVMAFSRNLTEPLVALLAIAGVLD